MLLLLNVQGVESKAVNEHKWLRNERKRVDVDSTFIDNLFELNFIDSLRLYPETAVMAAINDKASAYLAFSATLVQ